MDQQNRGCGPLSRRFRSIRGCVALAAALAAVPALAAAADTTAATTTEPVDAVRAAEADPRQAPPTGAFRLTAEGVPAGLIADAIERLGGSPNRDFFRDRADSRDDLIVYSDDLGAPVWEVFVPGDYDPSRPPGVFVFVNAGDTARPGPGWEAVFTEKNLIFVSPQNAGNQTPTAWRVSAAIAGVREVRERYAVDEQRLYVSGFSGGGRVSTMAMWHFPEAWTGAFPMCGANHIRRREAPHKPGAFYDPIANLSPRRLRHARDHARFVYFTGEKDFNRSEARGIAAHMIDDGFATLLIDEPGHGHRRADAESLARGLDFLDAELRREAEEAYREAVAIFDRGLQARAYAGLRQAVLYLEGAAAADARRKAEQIEASLAEDVAAAEAAIAEGRKPDAFRAIGQLKRKWRGVVTDDRVEALIAEARALP